MDQAQCGMEQRLKECMRQLLQEDGCYNDQRMPTLVGGWIHWWPSGKLEKW